MCLFVYIILDVCGSYYSGTMHKAPQPGQDHGTMIQCSDDKCSQQCQTFNEYQHPDCSSNSNGNGIGFVRSYFNLTKTTK